jgi:hypothetical protein
MNDVKDGKNPAVAGAPADGSAAVESGERRLRGTALRAERDVSDPDALLHVDEEPDSLYDDGLELDDEPKTLTSTDGGGNSKP